MAVAFLCVLAYRLRYFIDVIICCYLTRGIVDVPFHATYRGLQAILG
jgi:hypothetical protein